MSKKNGKGVVVTQCGRCEKDIDETVAESCWLCDGDLCYECWEEFGHCGHRDADLMNRLARSTDQEGRSKLMAHYAEQTKFGAPIDAQHLGTVIEEHNKAAGRTYAVFFEERELRLLLNCHDYAGRDPAGLPAHNLMLLLAKMAELVGLTSSIAAHALRHLREGLEEEYEG